MPAPVQTLNEIETRIRRLEGIIRNFREGRRRLEQLLTTANESVRGQIEDVLAINQGAIEARLQDLQVEKARLAEARLVAEA